MKLIAVLFAIGAAIAIFASTEKFEHPPFAPPHRSYVVPGEYTLDAKADRTAEGAVRVSGRTNLPPGTAFWIEMSQGQTSKVTVQPSGSFVSEPFTTKGKVIPPGKQKIKFSAYFNGAWQTAEVRAITGDEGRKLRGELFKDTAPDVIDSPKMLDYALTIEIPSLSQASLAIGLVKNAVLTVHGQGQSSATVGATVEWFMQPSTGMSVRNGWTAEPKGNGLYYVTFDYSPSSDGPAIWSVDMGTKHVAYVNHNAKLMSYLPPN